MGLTVRNLDCSVQLGSKMQALGFTCTFLLVFLTISVTSKRFATCVNCNYKTCSNDRCLAQGIYQMGNNGEAKLLPKNDYRVIFTCKPGYKLIGPDSVGCDLCSDVLNGALPVCVSVRDVCGSVTSEPSSGHVINDTSCNCPSIAPRREDPTDTPLDTSNLSTSSDTETTTPPPAVPKFNVIYEKSLKNASDDGILKALLVLSVALFILLIGLCIYMLRVKRDILQHIQSAMPETKSEVPELMVNGYGHDGDREREKTPEEFKPDYDYIGLETTRSNRQLVHDDEEEEEYTRENSCYAGETD